MIIGLSVHGEDINIVETFPTQQLTQKRRKVIYEASVEILRRHAADLTGLVIPRLLKDTDYDFEYFIEHVRIDEDERIARLPIVVATDSDDEFLDLLEPKSGFKEAWYRNIGVEVSVKATSEEFSKEFDPIAWETYQEKAGAKPLYAAGRHDQANTWGAYVVTKALSAAYPEYDEQARMLEENLLEDTFYKKRIQRLGKVTVDKKNHDELKSERTRFLKLLSKSSKQVLIVEDQLLDGWEIAYSAVFDVGNSVSSVRFAQDIGSAKESFEASQALIMLDVRLAPDRNVHCQEEGDQRIDEMSGVKLAQWFRAHQHGKMIPIVAATASNKSWTLEALLERGINSYWVKDAPETTGNINQGLSNLASLYRKLNATLEWSNRTRAWVEELYEIADLVKQTDHINGGSLDSKARSLHALLFRSFGPFSHELAEGVQMNLAFLLVFSCINDLLCWILEPKSVEKYGDVQWYIKGKEESGPVVTKKMTKNDKGLREFNYKMKNQFPSFTFPDVQVAIVVLERFGMKEQTKKFKKMKKIRNGLPLTHGKADLICNTSRRIECVQDKNITCMFEVLRNMKDNFKLMIP